tara:strand:- start:8747 stop:10087 length:1341 start_codon:yes stop_codon:yes gene_type:complete
MKISVIGSGYVGLVTGLCLAEKGHNIICVDKDESKVSMINSGDAIIHEKGLEELLLQNLKKNFIASTYIEESVLKTDLSIIAVGTPFDGKKIDLQYIKEASAAVGRSIEKKNTYHLIIVKSTVTPGTTDDIVIPIIKEFSNKEVGKDFDVGMNPEFLREGSAVKDFMSPDRIVLGSNNDKSNKLMREIYKSFSEVDFINTNNKTAEMIKYANNSFLATLISFSNEIGNLCASQSDIDAVDVMRGVHMDQRINPILENSNRVITGITSYLQSGCGFGGSCFPKDLSAAISFGKSNNNEMKLLSAVMDINKDQPMKIFDLINNHFSDLNNKNITILGLSFKPDTDDMRESPSIPIIRKFLELKANVTAFDPAAEKEAKKIFKTSEINYSKSLSESINEADIIVLLTSWPEFNELHKLINSKKGTPLVVDGRRALDKNNFKKYVGIGVN